MTNTNADLIALAERVLLDNDGLRRPNGGYVLAEATFARAFIDLTTRLREAEEKLATANEALKAITESDPEAYDECCGGGVQTSYDEPPECCANPVRDNAGRALARAALAKEPIR